MAKEKSQMRCPFLKFFKPFMISIMITPVMPPAVSIITSLKEEYLPGTKY